MKKILKYSLFTLASFVVIAAFLLSQSYSQLGVAIVLYPIIIFFAYKLFINKGEIPQIATINVPHAKSTAKTAVEKLGIQEETSGFAGITDSDKRDFLKMIGAAGISFVLFSIFNRKQPLFFGGSNEPGRTTLEDTSGKKINPAMEQPTDSYIISEIDESYISYYGFINKEGGWFIMREDPDNGSFRYTKGDSDFSGNWTGRENQNYDYYHNVFN